MVLKCDGGYCQFTKLASDREQLQVSLLFKRDELLHDISNNSWVQSEVSASDNINAKQELKDIVQDENLDRVLRVLRLAHQECIQLLYAYTHTDIVGGEHLDDAFADPKNYIIDMKVPTTFSHTSLEYLVHLIHEYLVCSVLSDWIGITMPEYKVLWAQRLEDMTDKITATINRRSGRVRRSQSPF